MRFAPRLGALIAPLLWILGVGAVYAHANLERSAPTSNAVLQTAPNQVQIWFSEEPELRYSEIAVYDVQARRLDKGDLHPVPGDARSLIVSLEQLPNGPYTVAWKTLSAVDGHVAGGAYSFAVGVGQDPGSPVLPASAAQSSDVVDPFTALVRAVAYLGTSVLVGGVVFREWVTGSVLGAHVAAGMVQRRLLLGSALLALVGAVGGLMIQAATASSVSIVDIFGAPLLGLLTTRFGLLLAIRVPLIIALVAMSIRSYSAIRVRWLSPAMLLASGALLLTSSLNSHAAAAQTDTTLAVLLDWVHLAGTAVWVGGLVHLVSVVLSLRTSVQRGDREAIGTLVARFSPLAAWSVVGLILSGTYQAILQVGTLQALTRTPYGQALLWKLALVVPMLGLGSVNAWWLRPRLAAKKTKRGSATPQLLLRAFVIIAGSEAALGLVILGIVGVLTMHEPARDALARMPSELTATERADDLRINLRVAPAAAGFNTLDVSLTDDRGRTADADRVTFRFVHLEHDMGENEITATRLDEAHWTAQGSFLSMVGQWQVSVLVRRPDRDDARADFTVPAADPTLATGSRGGAISIGVRIVTGILLILASVAVLRQAGRVKTARVAYALSLGTAAIGAFLLWVGVSQDVTPTFALTNPIPLSQDSLARGQEVYSTNCMMCHGLAGRGDGPVGRTLNPRPADLRVHVTAHTEGQLFWWISKGFPVSAMPAFEQQLSEEDRWHVLNYIIQAFGPDGRGG